MNIKCRKLLPVLLTMFLAGFVGQSLARGQNEVVGAIWQIAYGKEYRDVQKFRGTKDGRIWNMPDRGTPRAVGKWAWAEKDVKVKMEISGTQGAFEKYRGDYELVQIGMDPPSWQGEFTNKNGDKIPIKVRLLKD